jgi:hypothetical protein
MLTYNNLRANKEVIWNVLKKERKKWRKGVLNCIQKNTNDQSGLSRENGVNEKQQNGGSK